MTNLVCVPKKRNLSISFFEVSNQKGMETHRTLEWKLKRDVAVGNVRSLAQEEGGDPYPLDLVLLPLSFFNNNESGYSPTSIE